MTWINVAVSVWLGWFNSCAMEAQWESPLRPAQERYVSPERRTEPPGTGTVRVTLRIDQWSSIRELPGICFLKAQGYPVAIKWARKPYTNLPFSAFNPPKGKVVSVQCSGASYSYLKSACDSFRDAIVCPHCDRVIFMDYYAEYRKDFWRKND